MASQTDQDRFFEKQVMDLLDQLFGAALRMAKNRDDAEDLVADTVEKAWAGRDSLKDANRLRPWIFRILTHCFISNCRKKAVRPKTVAFPEDSPGDDERSFSLFEELHQPILFWGRNPEREFLNKLLREDLEQAVDTLPEDFRITIILSDLQGFSYKEISDILEVPVGTVRSRIARARGLLQKILWEHGKEAGLIGSKRTRREA